MYALHIGMCYFKFPGALLVRDEQRVGLIRLLSNVYVALSSLSAPAVPLIIL